MTLRDGSGTGRRRWLLLLAVGVAAGYLAGLVTPTPNELARPAQSEQPIQRSGVVTLDSSSVDHGYVTDGVLNTKTIKLLSKDGQVVHQWSLDRGLGGMAAINPDGSLLFLGKADPAVAKTQPQLGGLAGTLERMSWDGQVEWTFDDPLIHHDFTELPDGTIAVLRWRQMPAALAQQVPGGMAGTELDGTMWTDQLIEIDPATKATRVVWDATTSMQPSDYPIPPFMRRDEWTHANSVFYMPSDPITHQEGYLISFRVLSTIIMVSRATGQVLWSFGGLWVLNQQHDATLLDNGHVLLFDDGQYRQGALSSSRIVEIDPTTNKIVSSYSGYGIFGSSFYSAITGGAQRLPNGNTLATLGTKGQLMEITPDNRVVWDYRETSGGVDPAYPAERISLLFKSRSYPVTELDPLLAGTP